MRSDGAGSWRIGAAPRASPVSSPTDERERAVNTSHTPQGRRPYPLCDRVRPACVVSTEMTPFSWSRRVVRRLHRVTAMLRLPTLLLGGAVFCLGIEGCWGGDTCSSGLRCNGSVLEDCEATPNGYADWQQVSDCAAIGTSCIDDHEGHAQCQ